jgi:hypothetical protein
VIFFGTVMFAYDLLTLPTFILMIALGLLWRRESLPAVHGTHERSHGMTVTTSSRPR